jgi:zinc transport system substrate-binding protein
VNSKKILGAVLLVALIAGAIMIGITSQQKDTTQTKKVTITASYYPLYDFARNVGGDKVSVTNITPAGSEPHDYEPTPKQLITADQSTMFIYNGANMEQWVNKFLPDYKNTIVKASTDIPLREGTSEGGAAIAGIKDPHFWLDPVLAQQIVRNILAGLIKADPTDKDYFTANATAYIAKLAALDTAYKTGLGTCVQHTIITSHAAFAYLGARYNLSVLPIAGMSPDQEPSATELANLSNLVKQNDIKYVFFESLASPKLADTIAAETGAKTIVFDPIEGLKESDQQQGKNYLSVQEQNLTNLRTALECS